MISTDLRLAFFHIPRTAGSSIEHAVAKKLSLKIANNPDTKRRLALTASLHHANAEKLQPYMDNTFFKFTFVRNPWDRLYSAFCFGKHTVQGHSFENFVSNISNRLMNNIYEIGEHCTPQYHYINGCDFIGRFEQLHDDWAVIAQRFGLQPLEHKNKSLSRVSTEYRKYYTLETRRLVSQMYRKDIELLNYTF